jgi:hypothetical protein
MAKGKLSDAVKTFIVQSLACFDSPSVVAEAVRKEFAETITRQSVEGYDPTKRAGTALAPKWRTLFEVTRKAFLEDQSEIGIAHRSVRLRKLAHQVELNESRGNSAMVAQLLKQAAEEVGGSYTNRRELTGKDGKDLPASVAPVTIFQLPDNGRS